MGIVNRCLEETGFVKPYPLQLIRFGHSLGRNQVVPLVAPFLGEGIQNVGSDVSRGDTVNPTVVNPFDRQALGEMNNSCLGRIVLCNDERHAERPFLIEQ